MLSFFQNACNKYSTNMMMETGENNQVCKIPSIVSKTLGSYQTEREVRDQRNEQIPVKVREQRTAKHCSDIGEFGRRDDYAKDGGKELFTKMHCVL